MPQYLSENANVKRSMISDGTIVLGKVHESIVSSGVSIAHNSKVLGSIIMQNAVIEEGATVGELNYCRRHGCEKRCDCRP